MDQEMRLVIFNRFRELADEAGYDVTIRDDYSGRGMYGNKTVAIVTEMCPILIGYYFAMAVVDETSQQTNENVFNELMEHINILPNSKDNMGVDQMVYY